MEEIKEPEGTVFVLIVPLDRKKSKFATYFLKEMDETVYMFAKELIDARKMFDATRLVIKSLALPGSDDVALLKNNFIAMNVANSKLIDIIEPLEGELKKN